MNQQLSWRMRRVEHIHFVGIGGVGMCGIAEVLHNEGYCVTGSDLLENHHINRLKSLGIAIQIGHDKKHIEGANVIVRSTAVSEQNPEILEANERGIPVIPRAQMLAELMRFRYGIAIAGTHGKTTTTSLVSSILGEGGLDPSFVIGGKLNSCGSNAQLGKSRYFVAEADESDASFLYLKPMMAVVTNIDSDHMETYDDNFETLRQTFLEFLHHLPFYGLAVLCIEDPTIQSLLPNIERPLVTYGFSKGAAYRAIHFKQQGILSEFTVIRPQPFLPLSVRFPWPGRHNVLNALAAIAIATELGVSDVAILEALYTFKGVGRRFQVLGEHQFSKGQATIVDDYGHHPQEIISTIAAFREVWPTRRLIHVFQPHRYSRTKALFSQFTQALSQADEVLLLDIYSAGEKPIPGVTSETLVAEIQKHFLNVRVVKTPALYQALDETVREDAVVLMQGAGNIGQLAQSLMQIRQESA